MIAATLSLPLLQVSPQAALVLARFLGSCHGLLQRQQCANHLQGGPGEVQQCSEIVRPLQRNGRVRTVKDTARIPATLDNICASPAFPSLASFPPRLLPSLARLLSSLPPPTHSLPPKHTHKHSFIQVAIAAIHPNHQRQIVAASSWSRPGPLPASYWHLRTGQR